MQTSEKSFVVLVSSMDRMEVICFLLFDSKFREWKVDLDFKILFNSVYHNRIAIKRENNQSYTSYSREKRLSISMFLIT